MGKISEIINLTTNMLNTTAKSSANMPSPIKKIEMGIKETRSLFCRKLAIYTVRVHGLIPAAIIPIRRGFLIFKLFLFFKGWVVFNSFLALFIIYIEIINSTIPLKMRKR